MAKPKPTTKPKIKKTETTSKKTSASNKKTETIDVTHSGSSSASSSTASSSSLDVSECFREEHNCFECDKELKINECFPEDQRKDGLVVRCRSCWEKSKDMLEMAVQQQQVREAHKAKIASLKEKVKKEEGKFCIACLVISLVFFNTPLLVLAICF